MDYWVHSVAVEWEREWADRERHMSAGGSGEKETLQIMDGTKTDKGIENTHKKTLQTSRGFCANANSVWREPELIWLSL